jgi:integrase
MPFKRGKGFNYKKTKKRYGLINRTLGTKNRTRADELEGMLDRLYDSAHHDLFRAWYDRDVDLHTLEAAVNGGEHRELREELLKPDIVTLREAGEMAMHRRSRRPVRSTGLPPKADTMNGYEASFRLFMGVVGADTPCDIALVENVIEDFMVWCGADKEPRRDKPQTVNNHLNAISIVSGHALIEGWIKTKPVLGRADHLDRINFLEPPEWIAYLDELDSDMRAQMMFLFGSGCRLGESERLRMCDLRLDSGQPSCIVWESKTNSGIREVFLDPWVARALVAQSNRHGLSAGDFLFTIPRRTVQKEHNRAVKDAGIVKTYPYVIHDHRHSAAVWWAKSGMEMDKIQRQLGHKNITTTMKYATYRNVHRDLAKPLEAVGKLFGMDGSPVTSDNSGDMATPPLRLAEGG